MGEGRPGSNTIPRWADHRDRFSRTSRKHTALVSESWLITGEGVEFGQQPFGLALRFFSDRLAVDLGVILVGNALSRGFLIPWLSFAFHFGP